MLPVTGYTFSPLTLIGVAADVNVLMAVQGPPLRKGLHCAKTSVFADSAQPWTSTDELRLAKIWLW
jgi:hypothetical protein